MNSASISSPRALPLHLFLVPFVLLCAVTAAVSGASAAASKKPAVTGPGPLILEDVPQPLTAQQPRTESKRDHLHGAGAVRRRPNA